MAHGGAFGLANSHLLWTREAYPTRAYHTLGNLAAGGGRTARRAAQALPEGIGIGDPAHHRGDRALGVVGVDGINFLLNAMR